MLVEQDDFQQLEQLFLRLRLDVLDEWIGASLQVKHFFERQISGKYLVKERLNLVNWPLLACQLRTSLCLLHSLAGLLLFVQQCHQVFDLLAFGATVLLLVRFDAVFLVEGQE